MSNYLIDFADDATADAISAYLTSNQCTVKHEFKNLNKVYHVSCETIPVADAIVTSIIDDDANPIRLLEVIPVAQPEKVRDDVITVSDEKNWWKLYSMASVDLAAATATIPVYGLHTNTYVVDSGIEINHPEFIGQDISLLYSFTGDFTDTAGHGTALSSLIVGNTCGLTASTIKVVKIFDDNVGTKQSDMLHAFDAILADMSTSNKLAVVNLSWSIPKNEYIEGKINHIIFAGAVVVAAAGNSGTPIEDVTPASMPAVVTVGSYGTNFTPSNFSDYTGTSAISFTAGQTNSGRLDAWAPGEQIWVASLGGGCDYSSGTSCSAAIYSASCAYNAAHWMGAVKQLPSFCTDATTGVLDFENFTLADRTGLLDLTDPKYAQSVNSVCTFYNQTLDGQAARTPFNRLVVRYGESAQVALFNHNFVESFEWLDAIPDWLTVEHSFLVAKPTTDPTTENGTDIQDFKYRVYPLDGGAPIDCTASIVTLSSTFDREALPENDPLLDITLLVNNCAKPGACTTCSNYKQACTSTALTKVCYCYYVN